MINQTKDPKPSIHVAPSGLPGHRTWNSAHAGFRACSPKPSSGAWIVGLPPPGYCGIMPVRYVTRLWWRRHRSTTAIAASISAVIPMTSSAIAQTGIPPPLGTTE